MRHHNLALLLVLVGSAWAFACDDDDTVTPGGGAGFSGASAAAGAPDVGGALGTSGEAGAAGESGSSGEPGIAGLGGGAGAGVSGASGAGGVAGLGGAGVGGSVAGFGGAGFGGTGGAGFGGTGGAGLGGTGGVAGISAGSGGMGGSVQQVGSLRITLFNLPTGTIPSLTVTGPINFSANPARGQPTTFSNLNAGTYTIVSAPITVAGTQVDAIYDATVTGTTTVTSGATSDATITFAQRPGTGMLWTTNFVGRNAFGFSSTQIAATGAHDDAASVLLFLPDVGTSAAASPSLTFSSKGDAWVGYCRNAVKPQVVAKFSPAKLKNLSSPDADVVITLPSIDGTYDCASALAFDAAGNLWVGMYHGQILRYNAAALLVSGTPAPAVTLTSPTYFQGLVDLAFDATGNLWGAPVSYPGVFRLSVAQLAANNAATVPAVVLSIPTAGPGGLTIGPSGNLWVTDYNNNSLLKFNATDINVTSTPTAAITLTGIARPEQLAFDKAGNLWIASYSGSRLLAFAANDLTSSGLKTPRTTLTGNSALNQTYSVRFDPPAL